MARGSPDQAEEDRRAFRSSPGVSRSRSRDRKRSPMGGNGGARRSSPLRSRRAASPVRRSPSPKRRSPSPMRRSPSPRRRRSPSPKRRGRSPSPDRRHGGGGSPKRKASPGAAPTARSKPSVSPPRRGSPPPRARSRSPAARARSRSPVARVRSRSPVGDRSRRSRSPVARQRSRSPVGDRARRSRSPIRRRSRSPRRRRRSRSRRRAFSPTPAEMEAMEVTPEVESMFRDAVMILLERGRERLPVNVSLINDIMRFKDSRFSYRNIRGCSSFSMLCKYFAKRGLLDLSREKDSLMIASSALVREVDARRRGSDRDRDMLPPPPRRSRSPRRLPSRSPPRRSPRRSPAPRRLPSRSPPRRLAASPPASSRGRGRPSRSPSPRRMARGLPRDDERPAVSPLRDLDSMEVPPATQELFKEALMLVLQDRHKLPINVSIINDIMKRKDRSFSYRNIRGCVSFSMLCKYFAKRGLLDLLRKGHNVMLASSKLQAEVDARQRDRHEPDVRRRSRSPAREPRRGRSRSRSPVRNGSPARPSRRSGSGSPAPVTRKRSRSPAAAPTRLSRSRSRSAARRSRSRSPHAAPRLAARSAPKDEERWEPKTDNGAGSD